MNVRKRGLALLMCICMIFTLLPFSALAADSDVVYGQYVNGKWQQDTGATASKKYTDETTGANIVYSKEAKATDTPNVYDVTLTIKNTTTKVAPGASAVVLVIDNSYSMNQSNRIANAKQAARNFAASYGATGGERYLAVVKFAGSASALNFVTGSAPVNWLNVSDSANLSKVQTAIDNIDLSSGTNLSASLSSAKSLFNDSTVSGITNFKYAVVLTDGEPNRSDVSDKSAYDAAAQRATELKNTGCEVYTVGVSLNNKAETFLKNQVASSADQAYTTDNAAELNNIFSEIFKEIDKGITSGFTVADPMGDYAVLQNTELTDCVIADNGFTWTPKNGTSVTNSDGSTTTTYTLTYQVKLDVDKIPADGTYPLNGVTTLTFGGTTLNFNVPGVKGEVPRYTVTYNKGANGSLEGQDTDGNVVHSDVKKGDATPAAPAVTPDEGYWFTGWDEEIAGTVTADATYTAQYAAKKVLTVTAKSAEVTYNGETQSVTGFEQLTFGDYTVSGLTASASGTDRDTYTTTITGTAKVTDAKGTDVTEQFTVNTVNGTLTIDPATVTVKANDQSKVYGEADPTLTATVSGLVNGESENLIVYTIARKSGENVGTYTITPTGAAEQGNYVVKYETGTLTIAKADTALVVTANSNSKTYDGKALTDSGYKLTAGALAKGDELVVVVEGSQTDAGSSANVVKSVKVMRGDVDVTGNYNIGDSVNGTLTITKRDVTLTSETASKPYDGTALTKPVVTVTGSFVEGEVSDIKATGSVTYVSEGEVTNAITYTTSDSFKADNYNITKNEGKLSITAVETALVVTANDASKTYDGKALTDSGYKLTAGALAKGDELVVVVEGSQTDAGSSANVVKSVKVMRGDVDVTGNYNIGDSVNGTLTITKRDVTLTSETASKPYDGTALTKPVVTVTGSFVEGEVSDIKATGSVTYVSEGEVTNAITYTTSDSFKADNYNITKNEGKLSITAVETALVVTANDASKTYDGKALTDSGYKLTAGALAKGDELVVVVEGSQTDAGSSANVVKSVKVMRGEEDVTGNYNIGDPVDGTLTVAKRDVTLTSETASKPYDGTALTKPVVTVTGSFVEGEVSDIKATGSVTYVSEGEVTNAITYTTSDSFKADNYNITKNEGKLSITAVETALVVTANDASKTYDGTALTDSGYTYTEGVLAEGDKLVVEVEGSQTDAGSSANVVKSVKVMRGDVDVTGNYNIGDSVNGTLTITKRDVTLTSETASKPYDGTALTKPDVTVTGSFVEGEVSDIKATGSVTYVSEGAVANTIVYTENEGFKAENYNITVKEGTLSITAVETALVVTANDASKTYDGKALTDSGYKLTAGALAKGDELVVVVEGSQTDAGSSANVVKSVKVMRGEEDVTGNYNIGDPVDGTLTVAKRDVTLTSETASKPYDGTALTKPVVTVTGSFVEGEVSDIKATGSVTYVSEGEVTNAITYTTSDSFKADNYNITKNEGKLSITAVETALVVTANDASKTYDGTALTDSGYTYTEGVLAEGDKLVVEVEGSQTDAGSSANVVKSVKVMRGDVDVTGNYNIGDSVNGTLTITKRDVTLTSETASKPYDGTALTKPDVTVTGSFVEGEVSDIKATGSVTYVSEGEVTNTITYTTSDSFKADNYNITKNEGKLSITAVETALVVTANSNSKTYDGTALTDSGYTYTEGVLVDGDELVVVITGSQTDAGSSANVVTSVKVMRGDVDVTTCYTMGEHVNGTLTVNPKAVTFTGESDSKEYNGEEQEITGITEEGLLDGHTYSGLSYSAKGTDVGEYVGEFSGEVVIKDAEGNDVTKNYAVTKTPGTLTITKIQAEITVVINGATDTVYYNGKEQSVTGHDWTSEAQFADKINVTLNEEGKDTAKGTRPDTYYMGLTEDDFTVTSAVYTHINVVVNDGWLKINRRPVGPTPEKITVTITGNTDSKVYDGTEQNVNGYTWVSSDPSYTEKDFEFSGKADANGTYVGSYDMGITADQFKNINSRYTVEFIVETDGELKITPKPLTITAGSKEGVAPVTCDEWTATETAKGDTIVSVTITGIQPVPGESPNKASDAVIKNEAGVDVTNNYDITYVDGVLRAIEVLNKEEHFNYVIGYTDGTIRPGNNISRAEIATIFFRLLKDDVREKYMTTDCDFSDVASGAWCRRAIATLTNIGIIHGYTDGTFRPNAQITRAELATIIARFANLDVNTKTFSDITGHWAQKSIELAAGNGWINGYTDGTFRPNNKITRAETFAMINRVLDRTTKSVDDLLPQSDMNMWSDNMDESAWYYRDVQEATNYHKCDRVGDSIYEKWTAKIADIDWAVYQI